MERDGIRFIYIVVGRKGERFRKERKAWRERVSSVSFHGWLQIQEEYVFTIVLFPFLPAYLDMCTKK